MRRKAAISKRFTVRDFFRETTCYLGAYESPPTVPLSEGTVKSIVRRYVAAESHEGSWLADDHCPQLAIELYVAAAMPI